MIVQELIDALSKLPSDLSVKVYRSQDGGDGDEYNVYDDINFAQVCTDDDGVLIAMLNG